MSTGWATLDRHDERYGPYTGAWCRAAQRYLQPLDAPFRAGSKPRSAPRWFAPGVAMSLPRACWRAVAASATLASQRCLTIRFAYGTWICQSVVAPPGEPDSVRILVPL